MDFYKATMSDVEGVSNLFDQYRQFYNQVEDKEGAYRFIRERLSKGESTIFIARNEKDYVGFVQLYPTFTSVSMKRAWVLNDLFVQEEYRRIGVAQELIQLSIELCKETDGKYLTLETAATNTNAQKLYEKNGFVHDASFLHYTLSF